MSCNPAIGSVAMGHLVREVDALGGVMGKVADACGIQFRLLNTSRGPAVWSPRAQCDKALYRAKMREVLEGQPNLFIKQAEVVDLVFDESEAARQQVSESVQKRRYLCGDAVEFCCGMGELGCGEGGGGYDGNFFEWADPLRGAAVCGGAERRAGFGVVRRGFEAAGLAGVQAEDGERSRPRWEND